MKKLLILFVFILLLITIPTTVLFSQYKIVYQPSHLIWSQDKERGPDSYFPIVMINTAVEPESDLYYVRIQWINFNKRITPNPKISFDTLIPITETMKFSFVPDQEQGLVYEVVSTELGESDFHIVVQAYEWEVLKHIYTFDTIDGKTIPVQVDFFDYGRGKPVIQKR
tara:strand:+ start:555 stop:1058 length:504 start_codon:yes stop_codon:yes gene_type:complete